LIVYLSLVGCRSCSEEVSTASLDSHPVAGMERRHALLAHRVSSPFLQHKRILEESALHRVGTRCGQI
jgi:hypothetical protein